ncbi:MAG: SigE family RNA polymerase sigma factor [Actinomycetota bacterium]|jgi:RNA polymerase sigma-70 factor (sigma-E family)|nr:SigE family RNA polymerase sigma factor [Actinomycetota bacterium]
MRREPGIDFERYVAGSGPRLLKLAYLLTGNAADAEELVQECLSRVFLAWPAVAAADNPDSYVRSVMVNANRRRFRRRRVGELLGQVHDGQGSDDQTMVEDRDDIAHLLAQLPERQRMVVVLRYCEDLPEAAVAELLGCSTGTVKSQASRALAKLRSSASPPAPPVAPVVKGVAPVLKGAARA